MTQDRFIRITEVAAIVGFKRTAIRDRVKAGSFPAPTRISHKLSVWSEREVREWMDQQLAKRAA